jgi:hypothetical protein
MGGLCHLEETVINLGSCRVGQVPDLPRIVISDRQVGDLPYLYTTSWSEAS